MANSDVPLPSMALVSQTFAAHSDANVGNGFKSTVLIDLDAGLVRDRRPSRRLGADECREILRRADFRFRAQTCEAGLGILGLEDLVDRAVEFLDDRRRRSGRASSPDQNEAISLGYPLSAVVGTSGNSAERLSVATASARSRPPST